MVTDILDLVGGLLLVVALVVLLWPWTAAGALAAGGAGLLAFSWLIDATKRKTGASS